MGNALIFLGIVMGRKVVIASDVVMPQPAGSIEVYWMALRFRAYRRES